MVREIQRDEPRDIEGRVAVVIGAARGIGRETAVALARRGASIAGIDIAGPVSAILDYSPEVITASSGAR
jgi:NAD(P)-dependent dehydrogenase (short-subunit alcohol dehydrogenase family)